MALGEALSSLTMHWSPKVVARINVVVPRGAEDCPIANGEMHAMLVEPTGVANTGNGGGPFTVEPL